MNSNSGRRQFLKTGIGSFGLIAASSPFARALAPQCLLTPEQTPGPFYPGEGKFRPGFDLTTIPGRASRAQGQIIYVRGRILDKNCQPLKDASVEIWQACYSGRYNNPNDTHDAPLDPNFRYWSEVFTDSKGEYAFKTIKPGSYPAGRDWTRPPHIHFKIAKLGYRDLITQMYFQGEPLNEKDFILQEVPAAERSRVVIEFRPSPRDLEPESLTGTFDITLQEVPGSFSRSAASNTNSVGGG